ncbi:MAG: type VI secretion system lipoprotein TssJ [Pseudomonadales bacterium]|nr:type VI secretion system lipoprotein TssJ [Pseudomonadales bacterium]
MSSFKMFIRCFLFVVGMVSLGGCEWLMSDITKVDLRLIAKGDLNLDDDGRPSPIVVRIVELKSAQSFESAEFFTLYGAEKETLGTDLVASEEIELKPGDIKDLKIALQPESQLIGIYAAYRRLDQANWRMVLPFALHEKNQQTVLLGAKGLAVATR